MPRMRVFQRDYYWPSRGGHTDHSMTSDNQLLLSPHETSRHSFVLFFKVTYGSQKQLNYKLFHFLGIFSLRKRRKNIVCHFCNIEPYTSWMLAQAQSLNVSSQCNLGFIVFLLQLYNLTIARKLEHIFSCYIKVFYNFYSK